MNFELNGARLREARRYRHMTVADLAEKASVTKQMISRYERGNATPGLDVFQKIIQTLKFPLDYFITKDKLEFQDGGTFFRSRLTATQSEKEPSETYKRATAIVRDYFGEYVDFPELTEDQFEDDTPRQAAIKLRNHWGLGEAPISNMMRLLEAHGMVVAVVDSKSKKIDAHSGFYTVDGRSYYIVLVDKASNSFYRQQFTQAHELGHRVIHANVLNPQELDADEYRQMEKEADQFAAEFLLPAQAFEKTLGTDKLDLKHFLYLKNYWHVAIAAMVYRARDLGLVSADDYLKLQKKISYRQWRKVEPLDVETPPSTPVLLKQSLDLLMKQNIVDPSELSHELGAQYGTPFPNEILAEIIGVDLSQFSGEIVQLKPLHK
ncbi:helix-turn-helix domain-containing protein [Lactiplantibacillus plantarum]|uniref:helix-turn-helix domain-containing protein n=1 Tax=Lactiplantibacillus plantarum TaxID=1590 RepID=UPI0032DEC57A